VSLIGLYFLVDLAGDLAGDLVGDFLGDLILFGDLPLLLFGLRALYLLLYVSEKSIGD